MNNFTPSDWYVFKQMLAIDCIQGHATCNAMCQTTSDADADKGDTDCCFPEGKIQQ